MELEKTLNLETGEPKVKLGAPKVPEEYWEQTENAIAFFTHYASPHRTEADLPSDRTWFREERKQKLASDLRRLSRSSSKALERARRATAGVE